MSSKSEAIESLIQWDKKSMNPAEAITACRHALRHSETHADVAFEHSDS